MPIALVFVLLGFLTRRLLATTFAFFLTLETHAGAVVVTFGAGRCDKAWFLPVFPLQTGILGVTSGAPLPGDSALQRLSELAGDMFHHVNSAAGLGLQRTIETGRGVATRCTSDDV